MNTLQDKLAWQQWQGSQQGKNWLATNNNSTSSSMTNKIPNIPISNEPALAELKQLLGKLPSYFDTSGLEKAYDQQIQFGQSTGEQASNNASREFINRQALQGGDRSLGGLVRAQSMLPFLQQNAQLTGQKETAKLGASEALAKIQGDVAGQLGSLRTNYLSTLANYSSNLQQIQSNSSLERARLAQQGSQFDKSFGLDQQRLGLERERERNNVNQNQQQIDLQRLLALQRNRPGPTVHNTTINGVGDIVNWNPLSGLF